MKYYIILLLLNFLIISSCTSIRNFIASGDAEGLRVFLDRESVTKQVIQSSFSYAITKYTKDKFDIVSVLVEKGADIDLPLSDGSLPIIQAINDYALFRYLLETGADIYKKVTIKSLLNSYKTSVYNKSLEMPYPAIPLLEKAASEGRLEDLFDPSICPLVQCIKPISNDIARKILELRDALGDSWTIELDFQNGTLRAFQLL